MSRPPLTATKPVIAAQVSEPTFAANLRSMLMGRRLATTAWFSSLTAHAGSPVWAIHGEHNTVYLAGSVHLLKADDSSLPPAFDHAYGGARALVMELDMSKVDPMEAAGVNVRSGTEVDAAYRAVGHEAHDDAAVERAVAVAALKRAAAVGRADQPRVDQAAREREVA